MIKNPIKGLFHIALLCFFGLSSVCLSAYLRKLCIKHVSVKFYIWLSVTMELVFTHKPNTERLSLGRKMCIAVN